MHWPRQRWPPCRCCSAARTTASSASGRAVVQPGDLLYPIGGCDEVLYMPGRMRVRQIIAVGEDRVLLQETSAQHGPWRSRPRPAPSRSSPASRQPLPRTTARCRRDLAAPDLPAEAGPASPSRQRKRPPPSTRSASRASTGWPNPPQQICKPSRPDRPASRFPSTRHASPRPYPQAPHSLLTMNPAAPPHRGRSGCSPSAVDA